MARAEGLSEVHERLQASELQLAHRIQQALLPQSCPSLGGWEVAGFSQSAWHLGGDLYDIVTLGKDSALLVIADVMGKGMGAALFAASLRALARSLAEWSQSPGQLLKRINKLMFEELSSVDMFITAQLVLLEAGAKRLVVASAGHCPLLLSDQGGQSRAVAPTGLPLGIVAEAEFGEERVGLGSWQCGLLYTDGVSEARNRQGELYGQERLEQWLAQRARARPTARRLRESCRAELERFQGQSQALDDQTVLVLAAEGLQPGLAPGGCEPLTG